MRKLMSSLTFRSTTEKLRQLREKNFEIFVSRSVLETAFTKSWKWCFVPGISFDEKPLEQSVNGAR